VRYRMSRGLKVPGESRMGTGPRFGRGHRRGCSPSEGNGRQ
jgi:hypothetical protein